MKSKIKYFIPFILIIIVLGYRISRSSNDEDINTTPDTEEKVDMIVYRHITSDSYEIGAANDEYYFNGEYEEVGTYACSIACKGYNIIGNLALISDDANLIVYNFIKNELKQLNIVYNSSYAYLVGYENTAYGVIYANDNQDIYYSLKEDKTIFAYTGYLSTASSPTFIQNQILGLRVGDEKEYTIYYEFINLKDGSINKLYSKTGANECEGATIQGNKKQQFFIVNTLCSGNGNYRIYNTSYENIFNSKEYDMYTFDTKGNIYLANFEGKHVYSYNNKGVEQSKSIKYNKILMLADKYMIVVDDSNNIIITNLSGKTIAKVGKWESTYYFNYQTSSNYNNTLIFYITDLAKNNTNEYCTKHIFNKKENTIEEVKTNVCV